MKEVKCSCGRTMLCVECDIFEPQRREASGGGQVGGTGEGWKTKILRELKEGTLDGRIWRLFKDAVQDYLAARNETWPKDPTANKRLSLYQCLGKYGFTEEWYVSVLNGGAGK